MGGAKVIPFNWRHHMNSIKELMGKINGILFTGGGNIIYNKSGELTNFAQKVCEIIAYAEELNDNGTYFPIWGTCQGYELLTACRSPKENIFSDYDSNPSISTTIEFEHHAKDSRLFTKLGSHEGSKIIKDLSENAIALFGHNYGISPETWNSKEELHGYFNLLATSLDKQGKQLVATIEAKDYPFYGIQYHPEKNPFEWIPEQYVHSLESIQASFY